MIKIGCIIVTYNRIEKLKKALDAYENQSYQPDTILIVNNNSTDGTKEFLDEWSQKESRINKKIIQNILDI